jgi:hypothetical protein
MSSSSLLRKSHIASGQRGGAVQVVKNTMASLQEMIQWIMKRNIDSDLHYREMERRIRVFPTCFARLKSAVRDVNDKSESKPGWLFAYNFLTLLNLPDQVQTFGSPRWHWEGTVAGEVCFTIRQTIYAAWPTARLAKESINLLTLGQGLHKHFP